LNFKTDEKMKFEIISMFRYICIFIFQVLILTVVTYIDDSNSKLNIIWPADGRGIARANIFHIAGTFNPDVIDSIQIFTLTSRRRGIPLLTDKDREEVFPESIVDMFSGNLLLKRFLIRVTGRGVDKSIEYKFSAEDMIDIEKFWYSDEFRKVYEMIYDDNVRHADVEIIGWERASVKLEDEYFFATVLLKPGLNSFFIFYFDKGGALNYADSVSIFREAGQMEPDDLNLSDVDFHSSFEENCSDCHDFSISDPEDTNVENDECVTCHSGFMRARTLHPPVEEWECLYCHKRSDDGFRLTDEYDEVSSLCFSCHSDMEDVEAEVIHPPFESGECLTCHDPHSGNSSYLVIGFINDICLSCHEIDRQAHPVVGHPLRSSSDPIEPEKEFSCASCHNPHFSDVEKLLWIRKEKASFCRQCHTF
jgi:predicted CXXCH cytochrome family protein